MSFRQNEHSAEEEALLPGHRDPPSQPRWKFWQTKESRHGAIRLEQDPPDDTSSFTERIGRHKNQAKRIGLCALCVLLGVALGGYLSQYGHLEKEDKHGPMVPPIFKLPPVGNLNLSRRD